MDLWIRSQKKGMLIKVNDFKIMRLTKDGYEVGSKTDDWHIIANDNPSIAIYKTKERALQVLDEIHQRLINLQIIETTDGDYIDAQMKRSGIDCVYQMPKE